MPMLQDDVSHAAAPIAFPAASGRLRLAIGSLAGVRRRGQRAHCCCGPNTHTVFPVLAGARSITGTINRSTPAIVRSTTSAIRRVSPSRSRR